MTSRIATHSKWANPHAGRSESIWIQHFVTYGNFGYDFYCDDQAARHPDSNALKQTVVSAG